MNFFALSGLLNGLAATGLTLLVFVRAPHDERHRTYGLFGMAVAVWSYGYFAWQMADSPEVAALTVHIFMVGAICIPVTYLHHILILLNIRERHRRLLQANYLLGGAFVLASVTPLFISGLQPRLSFPFWPVPGPLFHLFLVWWSALALLAPCLLAVAFRKSKGVRRTQYMYLMIGSAIGYAGGATNFPLWYDIPFPPYGTILTTVYVALVAYTLLRHRLLDFSLALEKGVSYLLLMLLIALPAYPILLFSQKMFFGTLNLEFSALLLFLFLVTVVGVYHMKGVTQVTITRTLFPDRYDRYETLSKFSKVLVTILDLKSLSDKIVQTLGQVMEVKTAKLFIKSGGGAYLPLAAYRKPDIAEPDLKETPNPALLAYLLASHQSILVREELEEGAQTRQNRAILQGLHALEGQMCLPFINKNHLVGFCILGARDTQEPYHSQDFELLRTLTQEAAIALDNAILYEELKRSQAMVQRTDRLRSLETMAGGLAHEIRNPLTSIKTFLQMVSHRFDDKEFLSNFGSVVAEDVARIERLTKEILEYARPTELSLKIENVNDLLESCLYTIRAGPFHEFVTIETDLAIDLPSLVIDRQQIKQVLLNLLMNAVEAMEPSGGTLLVRTQKVNREGTDSWISIEVSDTGVGIPPSDLDHIFDPFFTTKHISQEHEGTGLGLAIAHQIVQEHKGLIEVTSEEGRGTSFFISLPVRLVPVESQA